MPSGTRLVVSFDSAQRRGEAVVTIVDGAGEVTVRAPAGAVTYDAGPDRLAIGNGNSSASYSIEIPADAPWVEIRVAERRVLLKEGPRVTLARGPTTTAGPYRLPLQP
jgi:hypothetical protein